MADIYVKALEYVRNTNGGATRAHFLEDHEPIGERLWERAAKDGAIRTDENGRLWLTDTGHALIPDE